MTTLAACAALFSSEPTVRTLADVPRGRRIRVAQVRTPGALGERLLEMGMTPGTEVDVLRRSLLGGHVQLGLRGFILSLSAAQAQDVDVQLLP